MTPCNVPSKQTDLFVYTENILKLYEHHPKLPLSDTEQLVIFKGIIEAINTLSLKFGEFGVGKDMIGYNSSKKGKAWINENFCVNTLQNKRSVRSKEERARWEKDVIEELVKIGKLGSADKNVRNCKFYYAMKTVTRNSITKFSEFKESEIFKNIEEKEGKNVSKEVELSSSQRINLSNELVSTDERGRND